MKIKKIPLVALFFFTNVALININGCSSAYRAESFSSKIDRFNPTTRGETFSIKLESFPSKKFVSENSQNALLKNKNGATRDLASVNDSSSSETTSNESMLSNKRLYFITLYSQYLELQRFQSTKLQEIKICPNFHGVLVDFRSDYPINSFSNLSLNYSITDQELGLIKENFSQFITNHPELILAISNEMNAPRIIDKLTTISADKLRAEVVRSYLNHAIVSYTEKLKNELIFLCNNGHSESYYNFENLVSIKFSPENAGNFNVINYFKTPVVFNHFLIEALKQHGVTQTTTASRDLASVNSPYTSKENLPYKKYFYDCSDRTLTDSFWKEFKY